MKIGYESVFYLSGKPVSLQDEMSVVLAHAYRLAYEEYLRDSFWKKVSRFVHATKPKRITTISRIVYKLRVVPFAANEVLVSDSCSNFSEKIEIISLNATSLLDSSGNLHISASTNQEQSEFIRRLRAVQAVSGEFRKREASSPFLSGSGALARVATAGLQTLQPLDDNSPVIKSEQEIAEHPEGIRDQLSVFVGQRQDYIVGLNQSKERIAECSRLMISAIEHRYPIKHHSLRAAAEFGWRTPDTKPENWSKLLHPADGLIEGLQLEVKPDVDKIERDSRIEKERVEQTASLESRRIEQNFSVELSNLRRDKELSLKRRKAERDSLESQVDTLESEVRKAKATYEEAQDDYEEATQADTVQASAKLEDRVERLQRVMESLEEKLDDAGQALETVEKEITSIEEEYERSIQRVQHNKSLALSEHDAKLETMMDALKEKRRRSIEDKMANVVLIQQEKGVLEEVANKSLAYGEENLEERSSFEGENLWDDKVLIQQKIEAIEALETSIRNRIDDALKSITGTSDFLHDHVIRINDSTPSATVEILIPLWYVEIMSESNGQRLVEVNVISPSELVLEKADSKSILGISFRALQPAIASAAESIRSYRNVQECGRSNNQVGGLDPGRLLPQSHWIVQRGIIAKKFYESIQKDFRKSTNQR